jgi:hypothetical protein
MPEFSNAEFVRVAETSRDCQKTNPMQFVSVAKSISPVLVVENQIMRSVRLRFMGLFAMHVYLIFMSLSRVGYAAS